MTAIDHRYLQDTSRQHATRDQAAARAFHQLRPALVLALIATSALAACTRGTIRGADPPGSAATGPTTTEPEPADAAPRPHKQGDDSQRSPDVDRRSAPAVEPAANKAALSVVGASDGAAATRDGFTRAPQKVGTPTDGVALKAIRHARHDGFYRFVFDLDGDVVAASEAGLSKDGRTLTIDLNGLRHDETGNRPLTTESGRPVGKAIAVGVSPVRSYGRAQVLDDSQIRYQIQLDRAASFRLRARRRPPQVIVDIARGESAPTAN